jgi:hypothetical protein
MPNPPSNRRASLPDPDLMPPPMPGARKWRPPSPQASCDFGDRGCCRGSRQRLQSHLSLARRFRSRD